MHALSQGQLRDVLQALSSSGCVRSMIFKPRAREDWQGNASVISITFCRDCFQLQQASKKCPAANLRCLTIKEVGSSRQYQIISTHSDMQSCCKTNFYKGCCFFESIRQWSLNLDVFYQADSTGRWEGPAWILRWRMGNAVSFGRF